MTFQSLSGISKNTEKRQESLGISIPKTLPEQNFEQRIDPKRVI
jgi:hypothetical protein